jgi:hypothetical protein
MDLYDQLRRLLDGARRPQAAAIDVAAPL